MTTTLNIAILASGNGSNAENLIRYFNLTHDCGVHVAMVMTNKPDARVISRARSHGVPVEVVSREQLNTPSHMLALMESYHIDALILAGFLLMLPQFLIDRFPERVVNIHPSLLPRHGGKGMYGRHVHQAVIDAGDTHSGITIHMVNGEYDRGRILFQNPYQCLPDAHRPCWNRPYTFLSKNTSQRSCTECLPPWNDTKDRPLPHTV